MKVLKARIKPASPHYAKGLNQKGKTVWLSITGFKPTGLKNFRINAIRQIKGGFAEYEEIWLSKEEITLKQVEEGQLTLELYSKEEFEKMKSNPKFYNKRRFELITETEKQYLYAPDRKAAEKLADELGYRHYQLRLVKRLSKHELKE